MRWLRHLVLLVLAGVWCALLLAFPWAMHQAPALGAATALFFSQLCHQDPSRSFALAGITLPVCARCLAFYLGGLVGIACYPMPIFRSNHCQEIKRFFVASLCLVALDAGFDLASIWQNTFFSRSLTGALFGGACGLLLSHVIQNADVRSSPGQMEQASVNHPFPPSA
ncbi:MAG: DUF2085 domain-containing protein [Acidobacteria bacterium]|nr:DUF2085 domain-containing protein [Acidobacteriota bacterium]